MTASALMFAGALTAITLGGGLTYRRVWMRIYDPQFTPTGFGVFLAPALLGAALIFRAPSSVPAAWACVSAASALYWLDDVVGLSARLRMVVSFVTGVAICALLLSGQGEVSWGLLIGGSIAAGALNVVLTNIVNFYDGADLNLATFIALTAGGILLFAPAHHFIVTSAVACLGFIVPFAVLNSRPRTIYLGDAGSFAFACFLTLIAVIYVSRGDLAAQIAVPLALPALDTFYVLIVRIVEKHDLLTRNYMHLYQRLNQYYRGFGYLLPQIVNAGLLLACAAALEAAGLNQLLAVAAAMVLVTVPFYFACRKFLLPPAAMGDRTV